MRLIENDNCGIGLESCFIQCRSNSKLYNIYKVQHLIVHDTIYTSCTHIFMGSSLLMSFIILYHLNIQHLDIVITIINPTQNQHYVKWDIGGFLFVRGKVGLTTSCTLPLKPRLSWWVHNIRSDNMMQSTVGSQDLLWHWKC